MKRQPIITMTNSKVIIKWDRLNEVLTREEKILINKLLGKITDYDKGQTHNEQHEQPSNQERTKHTADT